MEEYFSISSLTLRDSSLRTRISCEALNEPSIIMLSVLRVKQIRKKIKKEDTRT
jgi:hypothetical protein